MVAHRWLIVLGVLAIGLAGCSEERKREAARLERLASGDTTTLDDSLLTPDEQQTNTAIDSAALVQTEPQAQPPASTPAIMSAESSGIETPVQPSADSTAAQASSAPVSYDSIPDVNAIPTENGHPVTTEPTPSEMPRRPVSVYTVQVGSAGTESEANTYLEKYRRDGYEPYLSTVTTGGRDIYRIRIGKLGTQAEAIRLRDELSARYGIKPWVDKITE